MDVARPDTLGPALRGCDAAVYLVHSMAESGDYERRELEAAQAFRRAAEDAGVRRVVYLGGFQPEGPASKHLRSRIETGRILRSSTSLSTIELRAGMIIGCGSQSWCIVRDLAARLPVMVLPRWLESKSQPIGIADVNQAIAHALELQHEGSAAYGLPGPETLSGSELLVRVAGLMNVRPFLIPVPLISPRLSSYWLQLVTRADQRIAQELVEGLTGDLLAQGQGFWELMPAVQRQSFDEAAGGALEAEENTLSLRARAIEKALRGLGRTRSGGAAPIGHV